MTLSDSAAQSMIYLTKRDVIQTLQHFGITADPVDAGLVWMILSSTEPPTIPNVRLERRFSMVEIIFPKTYFSFQLDQRLDQIGFTHPELVPVRGQLALTVSNLQGKPESVLLNALEKCIPGFRLKNLVIVGKNQCGVLFEADLTEQVIESAPALSIPANTKDGVYEIWTDASFDTRFPNIVGYGIVVKRNGELIYSVARYATGTQAQSEYIAAEQGLLYVDEGAICNLYLDARAVVDSINSVIKSPLSTPPNIRALPSLVGVIRARNVEVSLKGEAESPEIREAHRLANEGRRKYISKTTNIAPQPAIAPSTPPSTNTS